MQTLSTDIDSIGGGFGGAGFGNNPLLWLITLGFLKDGSIGGGNQESANSAKLDCLAQQHQSLSQQIAGNNQASQFQALAQGIDAVGTASRDSRDAISAQLNQMAAASAECCCENRVGIQGINTAIALQTAALTAEGKNNTQEILSKLCDNQAAIKDAEIRNLQQELQTQTILANLGGHGHGKG